MRALCCALVTLLLVTEAASLKPLSWDDQLSLSVGNGGNFSLLLNGELWFESGPTAVMSNGMLYSTATSGNTNLILAQTSSIQGEDSMGEYVGYEMTWGAGGAPFVTSIRLYTNAVAFQQSFPQGMNGTATSNRDGVVSCFPSFVMQDLTSGNKRGYVAWAGDMSGEDNYNGVWDSTTNDFAGGVEGTGPIVVFSQDLSTSFVLSPLSNFMAASQYWDSVTNSLQYGVMGFVTSIPALYSLETILFLSADGGINSAMEQWGDVLLNRYGKTRDGPSTDFSLTHLGYSTDNGAYYYYHTENNATYEQTILDVKAYSQEMNIPYRYILLDSWWYYKGISNGVLNWTGMPSIFPDGMQWLYNQTEWPVVGHNRYWSPDNVYAKQNGGQWDFIVEPAGPNGKKAIALPIDQDFWYYLMSEAKKWGLIVYEQDWLDVEFDNMNAILESATLGRQWLMQMGIAADATDLTIQYCMSHCRHIMQSVEIPAVTHARSSDDYSEDLTDQWNIGTTGIFAWALGLGVDKDNYWSTPVQPGNPYGASRIEPYNRLQSAVITLSNGPIAPSDMIGGSDVPLIMRSCTQNGVLLKPLRPATEMDEYFVQSVFGSGGPQGHVWWTTSSISNLGFSNVLAVELDADYQIFPQQMYYDAETKLVAYEANTTATIVPFDAQNPITLAACDKFDFQVYAVAPVLANGWALLGEPDKWVPVSAMRFSQIEANNDFTSVVVHGSAGEVVTVNFYSVGGDIQTVVCTLPVWGTAVASVPAGTCQ